MIELPESLIADSDTSRDSIDSDDQSHKSKTHYSPSTPPSTASSPQSESPPSHTHASLERMGRFRVSSNSFMENISADLHEVPGVISKLMLSGKCDDANFKWKALEARGPNEAIVEWSFKFQGVKDCFTVNLILCLTVIKQDENEIIINAVSVINDRHK
ncbi:hypothetical protein TrVE_jg12728 [Triparma verrucosa]|uniref:Uncharacterized protein n=1 Tax=Triparma verrucosa TaxID=1606542 RepID=A0A9W7KT18_9STRA|nr:hypothetical protein TrVE_jg12728 [Triparma verrucosa]